MRQPAGCLFCCQNRVFIDFLTDCVYSNIIQSRRKQYVTKQYHISEERNEMKKIIILFAMI